MNEMIGKKFKITQSDGSYFFGIVRSINETHVKCYDVRRKMHIYVPISTAEFAEVVN